MHVSKQVNTWKRGVLCNTVLAGECIRSLLLPALLCARGFDQVVFSGSVVKFPDMTSMPSIWVDHVTTSQDLGWWLLDLPMPC